MLRTMAAAAAMFLACPLAGLAADAPMFRGNAQHSGVYAGPGPAVLAGVLWKFQTGGKVLSSPAVVADTVYVASTDGVVYAVSASDGVQRWKFATGARITSSPAVVGGMVYINSYDGNVYAIDAATGKQRWVFATLGERRFIAPHLNGALPLHEPMPDPWDFYLSSPAVSQNTVYVGSGDHNVYALDAGTGRLRWKFRTGNVVHSSPAVANGTVYVGSWDAYFYALDSSNGTLRWKYKTGEDHEIYNHVGIQSSPAVVDGVVYFGSRDAHVYALDATTGTRKWQFATVGGAWASSSPAVAKGVVYFGEGSSGLYRGLDARTGAAVFTLEGVVAPFSSPAIAGDMLYVGDFAGKVSALDLATRTFAWTFQTGTDATSPQAAISRDGVDGQFYDNMVIRVNGFTTRGVFSSPVVVNGVVFVGAGDGALYAFH